MRNAAVALWLACVVCAPHSAWARAEPADGTVFIRLIGSILVLSGGDEDWQKKILLDLPHVEVGTGSGFIISAQGWVITNHHVISGGKLDRMIDGVKVEIAIDVERIEVVIPGAAAGFNTIPRRVTASLAASDPELDLAVLYISAPDLPYVPLGDSDAVAAGDPVSAMGYPFGSMLEIGKPSTSDTVPSVTISGGAISALRRNDNGEIRYLQTSAQLNPGNSGGPIVDQDGYAVAVAQLKLTGGSGVGFGVPINLVKGFLRRHGLDQSLTATLLELGSVLDAAGKGVRLRVPYGFQDVSPVRLRVEAPAADGSLALRIDRLATPWTLEQLETALQTGEALERFQASGSARRSSRADKGRRVVSGFVTGTEPATNRELSLMYSLVDLGREKVVARYVGSAEAVALNRSVLQASLADLEATPLLTDEVARASDASLQTIAASRPGSPAIATPSGWIVEAGVPTTCAGLTTPMAALSTSPAGDFTVSFRAAWWPNASIDVRRAARGCAPQAGTLGEASYAFRLPSWGSTYLAQGVFVAPPNGGLWQLEMIVPETKGNFVTALFDAWVNANGRQ